MQSNGSEERTMNSTVEDPIGFDGLLADATNKEELVAYKIEDDTSDDQTQYEKGSIIGATLRMDSRLMPFVEEPLDLELKMLLEHLE